MREVKRKARPGEYIKLIGDAGFNFNKAGDVLKVSGEYTGSDCVYVLEKDQPRSSGQRPGGYKWNYLVNEYVVLEGYVKEDINMFTKKDLRTGDIIEHRNGDKYMVMLGVGPDEADVLVRKSGYNKLSKWRDDLTEKVYDSDWDIMKVWRPKHACRVHWPETFNERAYELMFERKEVQKLTVAEIAERLGYEVEVIEG